MTEKGTLKMRRKLGSVEVLFLWLFLRTIFRNSNRFCREYPAYCQKIDAEVRKIGPKRAMKTKPQQSLTQRTTFWRLVLDTLLKITYESLIHHGTSARPCP